MAFLQYIVDNPWTYNAVGLSIDIVGFSILMTELAAAQKSEFRTYNSDVIVAVHRYRSELLKFLGEVKSKTDELVAQDDNPYQCFREVLGLYFSENFSREKFDELLAKFKISSDHSNAIGLRDHINFNLGLKEARNAVEILKNEAKQDSMSSIEKKIFLDMYSLPEMGGRSVINWYQDMVWGERNANWMADEYAYFRQLMFRRVSLKKRRTRFLIGATLVIFGFVVLLAGSVITATLGPLSGSVL